eukprot:TRINITY_DN68293_c0_g1_i1.p1 TRINITY_DN68293_c0_g1~~TRINITY_DN68293_c0_g1_i1.p1  ORF type:complete len:436 (+),score=34.55 TRINITY_DN68293_c0_g1_i1:36-1310(+)
MKRIQGVAIIPLVVIVIFFFVQYDDQLPNTDATIAQNNSTVATVLVENSNPISDADQSEKTDMHTDVVSQRLESSLSNPFADPHPSSGSKQHFRVSDGMLAIVGDDIIHRRPPYNRPPGKHFHAHYTSGKDWEIVNGTKFPLSAVKKCLDGKWLHIAGDSTSRQLFNSLLSALDTHHTHHIVQKYDDCATHYHQKRMSLLKAKPKNHTAISENHLWLCDCRQHLIWWSQEFNKKKDGFDFKMTYSYKELIHEAADMGLMYGNWTKRRYHGHVVGNLFAELADGNLPDVLIANSGGHAFHLNQDDLDNPSDAAIEGYAKNISKYVNFVHEHYLERKTAKKKCYLWKANNVPPPKKCPNYQFALNFVTVPALLAAGLNVIDPEELSRKQPGFVGKPCDIHSAPQEKVAELALSAVVGACCSPKENS